MRFNNFVDEVKKEEMPISQLYEKLKGKEPKEEKLNIIILTSDPETSELYHTAKRIVKEGEKLGHNVYPVSMNGAYMKFDGDKRTIHNRNDEKGFEVDKNNTIVIVRGSVAGKSSWMDLLSQLEKAGLSCINNRETLDVCGDKYRSMLRLADFGLTQPKTALIPDKESVKDVFEKLEIKFPAVMKTLFGSKGVGVLFVESEKSLEAITQLLYKMDDLADLLVQEYIKTDYDIRSIVMSGKVMGAMKRGVVDGDFRSNYSQGGVIEEIELTDKEIEDSILAAKAVDGQFVGVDFIPSKNREKDPPYIIEVNSSPGTEGIEKATGRNIVKEMLQHFSDPKNRHSTPDKVGFKEMAKIEPLGDLVAKFDTGNGSTSVLHADKFDIDEKNKKVHWVHDGKKQTDDLIDIKEVQVGGLRDYKEKRPVIKKDIEFLGTLYKNVPFTLDDRSDRTPLLLNRELMKLFNISVNPSRDFIVTTKFSED